MDKQQTSEPDVAVVVSNAVSLATGTGVPNGEDLLPPELQAKYRQAKERLRRKPRGEKAVK